tara:strand:+ start:4809 stop:5201 length:393 start_codon:yes stop_codon:yes gene_type:complete
VVQRDDKRDDEQKDALRILSWYGPMTVELEKGKAYFDVSYSDDDLIIPNIETLIYVGKDILESGKYYFQTPDCYFQNGPFYAVTDESIKPELEIVSMDECWAEMLETIGTLQELLKKKQCDFNELFGGYG